MHNIERTLKAASEKSFGRFVNASQIVNNQLDHSHSHT